MPWNGARFEAPYSVADKSDPYWYCRNRAKGYGMHPGREAQAVRTFRCPHSGTVEVFYSLGRMNRGRKSEGACSVQMFLNDLPLYPADAPEILSTTTPKVLRFTCSVQKGDALRLHVDSMGDINRCAVALYRQRIGYLTIEDET